MSERRCRSGHAVPDGYLHCLVCGDYVAPRRARRSGSVALGAPVKPMPLLQGGAGPRRRYVRCASGCGWGRCRTGDDRAARETAPCPRCGGEVEER